MRSASLSARALLALAALLILPALAATRAQALDRSGYDELQKLMADARTAEADVFAPGAWAKATAALARADQDIAGAKKQETLDKHVAEAREFVENARKATDVCRLALQQYAEPRDKARQARAQELVPAIYKVAEAQFVKATAKVESGDVKGGLKEADATAPLFNRAELEAIRVDILGTADKLIAQAVAGDAGKFALATLDRARAAREKADRILTANRADRQTALPEAKTAEYEARHATNIAQSVRSLARNDQAWEKLMLVYEIQMDRAGQAAGLARLPFDNGPQAAADSLIARTRALQAENQKLESALASAGGQLKQTLARLGQTDAAGDTPGLARDLDARVAGLQSEKTGLAAQIQAGQVKLAELSQEHAAAAGELAARREKEEKFRKAKELIGPGEGEVLYNPANDVVLRLSGLAFESGKSDLRENQKPLLKKAQEVINLFPGSRLLVEGHTDAAGDASANLRLSDKRAIAVMQYLRESLVIPADKISAVGYGSERPVASNENADGRAKNRRIDIIIMQ